MNQKLPSVQAGFRKGRGTRDEIAKICWIIEKAREFQKNIYFCFIDYAKAFDCVDHNKLWKILQQMGIPDHLTCLLRNLYVGQEATVRTGYGTTDWLWQPRQHIKKQRHYFADKGPSSQSYSFSSSHVSMWELDLKESWAPEKWCF